MVGMPNSEVVMVVLEKSLPPPETQDTVLDTIVTGVAETGVFMLVEVIRDLLLVIMSWSAMAQHSTVLTSSS